MRQVDLLNAVKRAVSLLKTLIVMQLIPEQAEKKCDESNHSSDDDENGGYGKAKWLDHINRSNEMHPEHKIDQVVPNQKQPVETSQRCQTPSSVPKVTPALIGLTICNGISWNSTDLLQGATRNYPIVDRAKNQCDQPSEHDAPDEPVDPDA